jgi:AbiV family abortive infection protein
MESSSATELTLEVLQKYETASIENASELLVEASLLLKHEHFARAYFLSVAAIEEIGKAVIAFDARGHNLRDSAVRSKLLKMMADHKSKIRAAFTGFLAADPRKNLEVAVKLMIALQYGREPSMYTDLTSSGSVQSPKAAVRPKAAADCVRLAHDCFASAANHLANAQPHVRTKDLRRCFTSMPSETIKIMNDSDFWWYFISRMEVGQTDIAAAYVAYKRDFLDKGLRFKQEDEGGA